MKYECVSVLRNKDAKDTSEFSCFSKSFIQANPTLSTGVQLGAGCVCVRVCVDSLNAKR